MRLSVLVSEIISASFISCEPTFHNSVYNSGPHVAERALKSGKGKKFLTIFFFRSVACMKDGITNA